jgi:site-specific DNA-methyltransferase (adenine-specific)
MKNIILKKNSCLDKSWEDERCFMNPPYGRQLPKFMQKAYNESKRGTTGYTRSTA